MTTIDRTAAIDDLQARLEAGGKVHAAVVGLARSGAAACRLLLARGARVAGVDRKAASELPAAAELAAAGVELVLGPDAALPEGVDLVVASPGVPDGAPPLRQATSAGVPIVSEIEVASWQAKGRIVGITGSNGKTTTTALTGALFEACGLDVRVGGNIGTPFASLVAGSTDATVHVLELSSFQLDATHTLHCGAAAILNVTEDHLDRHGTMAAYAASKARIFRNQDGADAAVLNAEDPYTPEMLPLLAARPLLFSSRRSQAASAPLNAWLSEEAGDVVIAPDGIPVLTIPDAEIPLIGRHNRENVMAALLCAAQLGVDMEAAGRAVREFRPVPHRLELVAEASGVRYVNDSKATNLDAVRTALEAIPGELVLLAGGRDKGADWGLLPGLLGGRARLVVTLGEAAAAIERALEGRVPYLRAGSMRDAVLEARRAAKTGDTVLLSPGCASFDMFENYEHRGRLFGQEVAACLGS